MHSTSWRYSDVDQSGPCLTSNDRTAWNAPPQGTPTAHCTSGGTDQGDSFASRSSRKQCMYQLLTEFEKCARQSEDFLVVRKVKLSSLFHDLSYF